MRMRSSLGLAIAIVLSAMLLVVRPREAVHSASPTLAAASETAQPKVTPTEEPPATPGPPSPTPPLPEEGGPAGGVIGGHLYIDENANGRRDEGEGTTGGTIQVDLLTESGETSPTGYVVATDATGYWEARALLDGSYRVLWEPQLRDRASLAHTTPPVQRIVINPNLTISGVVRIVVLKGANRVLDVDFGSPPEPPVAGARVQLPATGNTASGGVSANEIVLIAGLGASFVLALGLALRRRKRAR